MRGCEYENVINFEFHCHMQTSLTKNYRFLEFGNPVLIIH